MITVIWKPNENLPIVIDEGMEWNVKENIIIYTRHELGHVINRGYEDRTSGFGQLLGPDQNPRLFLKYLFQKYASTFSSCDSRALLVDRSPDDVQ